MLEDKCSVIPHSRPLPVFGKSSVPLIGSDNSCLHLPLQNKSKLCFKVINCCWRSLSLRGYRLIDRSIDWLIDRLIDLLTDWLIISDRLSINLLYIKTENLPKSLLSPFAGVIGLWLCGVPYSIWTSTNIKPNFHFISS